MNKFDKFFYLICSGVEKTIYFVSYPVVKTLDWLSSLWMNRTIEEREGYIKFLEDSMVVQRSSLTEYIVQCNKLTARLERYEKCGESMTLHHKEWLEGEVVRLTKTVRDVCERNESLNNDNAKLLSTGNNLANFLYIGKPKKRLTKKDKEVQKAVDEWNESARQWKI